MGLDLYEYFFFFFFWLGVRKVLKSPKFSITAEGGLAKKNGDDAAGGGGGGGG